MKLPKGDVARGMLLTDATHTVKLALINNDGTLGGDGEAKSQFIKSTGNGGGIKVRIVCLSIMVGLITHRLAAAR